MITLGRLKQVEVIINTTGCLLEYPYFKKYYKSIAIDLGKQQKLDVEPKERQQINLIGNLNRA